MTSVMSREYEEALRVGQESKLKTLIDIYIANNAKNEPFYILFT